MQRRAAVASRRDWMAEIGAIDCDALDAAVRNRIGEYWLSSAVLEHGSIAAFARFSLQLLELGAPAELVHAAATAMLEETEHARACFAVAGAYLRTSVGPAALSSEGAFARQSLLDVCRLTLLEACFGESVAAAMVAELAESAREPALRRVLSTIAEQELSHAALGFRFLKWAVPRLTERERRTLAADIQSELVRLRLPPGPKGEDEAQEARVLLEHGVMPRTLRDDVTVAAVRDMIAPCLAVILPEHHRARTIVQNVAVTATESGSA